MKLSNYCKGQGEIIRWARQQKIRLRQMGLNHLRQAVHKGLRS